MFFSFAQIYGPGAISQKATPPIYHGTSHYLVTSMAKSKILDLIDYFSAGEKAEFLLFLNSPYFVRTGAEELIRLFNGLCTISEKDPHKNLDKQAIHAIVYPEKPFSPARLERANTKLNQLAAQFLGIHYYQREDNEAQRSLDLAGAFRTRNMAAHFEKQLLNLQKSQVENTLESTENHLFRYQIAREEHLWRAHFNDGSADLAIPELLEYLSLFFYNERTEMLNRFLLQQKVGALKTPEIIALTLESPSVPEHFERSSPLIHLRKKLQDAFFLHEPNRSSFEDLMVLIQENEKKLHFSDKSNLYAFLRGYCSYLISNGNIELRETLHEIQKDNLSKGYLYHQGKLSPSALMSMVRVALLIHKGTWAKEMVEAHRDKIMTDGDSDEVYRLILAICLFEGKKYEDVLLHIQTTYHYKPFIFIARRLELRTYYELDSDLLPYKIDAFRKFLERSGSKKASDYELLGNNNFVNFLAQLTQRRPDHAKRSVQILQRIMAKKVVAERKWLQEKAQELA